jgi:hypothetical protein
MTSVGKYRVFHATLTHRTTPFSYSVSISKITDVKFEILRSTLLPGCACINSTFHCIVCVHLLSLCLAYVTITFICYVIQH